MERLCVTTYVKDGHDCDVLQMRRRFRILNLPFFFFAASEDLTPEQSYLKCYRSGTFLCAKKKLNKEKGEDGAGGGWNEERNRSIFNFLPRRHVRGLISSDMEKMTPGIASSRAEAVLHPVSYLPGSASHFAQMLSVWVSGLFSQIHPSISPFASY